MTALTSVLLGIGLWLGAATGDGLIQVRSNWSAAATVARVEPALSARGLRLFTMVDHAANAKAAMLELRPATLFIFGNPAAGTRLMQCAPTIAIDLPLKLLVWEDADGTVWVGYTDPAWLAERHGAGACGGVVASMKTVLSALAAEIAGRPR